MTSILLLGLFIGMQHAMEVDHVAAVASIASRQSSPRRIVTHGAVWGIGHTLTLMVFAGGAVWLGTTISPNLAGWLEAGVGVMLVLLGGHVLYRLWRDRIHFHFHRHGDGTVHFHAHSHAGQENHDESAHEHDHPKGIPYRTLAVGMMHGMAGSAALIVITASSVNEPILGMAYVVLFGLGSVVGMAALSALIAVPLSYTSRALTWANNGIQAAVGAGTAALGVAIVFAAV